MQSRLGFAVALAMIAVVQPASAALVLDFTGLDSASFADGPLNYYAGGLSLEGNGPGPDYGISFTDNAFTCSTLAGEICEPVATAPPPGNLVYFSGSFPSGPSYMDVAGGFTGTLSFYYNNIFAPLSIDLYSGLDGTGTLLASLVLPAAPDGTADPSCNGVPSCPFLPAGVSFGGVARSVDFSDTENFVLFADIKLEPAVSPVSVPEPLTLALFGAGLALAARRRRMPR